MEIAKRNISVAVLCKWRQRIIISLFLVLLVFVLQLILYDRRLATSAFSSPPENLKVILNASSTFWFKRTTSAFPKIIHQTWESERVPRAFEILIKSWLKFHPPPEWQYYFWTAQGRKRLVDKYYPALRETYKKYEMNVSRADAARILMIHRYGGVYADLDMEAVGPLDEYVMQNHCFMASNQPLHDLWEKGKQAINALFGCAPRHHFFEKVIEHLKLPINTKEVVEVAGPTFIHNVLKDYYASGKSDNILADPEIFTPTIDMVVQKQHLRKICSNETELRKLGPLRQRDCLRLMKNSMANFRPLKSSLTVHYWYHTYGNINFIYNAPAVNIRSLIPHVLVDPL